MVVPMAVRGGFSLTVWTMSLDIHAVERGGTIYSDAKARQLIELINR
jgi:hypothetical protein